MAPQCQALYVSDERRCTEEAFNANGLYCRFHARQVYSLYKGYKRRNAALDALVANPPEYIAKNSELAISELTFKDIDDVETLKELHAHLLRRYALLDRVIRARRLHHSRFYALELDYGHQHYLDHLNSQKHRTLHSLEKLERRTAEVLYDKQKWFRWVRQLEDIEEGERDAEKKKLRQEAALFKRNWKEAEARLKTFRAKEDKKRQAEFLDKAWEDRQKLRLDQDTDDEEWDPIEDVVEDERGSYIELIRHFLWQEPVSNPNGTENGVPSQSDMTSQDRCAATDADLKEEVKEDDAETSTARSKAARKRARQKAKAAGKQATDQSEPKVQTEQSKPGDVHVESLEEMRTRLSEGHDFTRGAGYLVKGTPERPQEVCSKTLPIPRDEVDVLLGQITDIKQLLFCRLLLAHATLLPAALRANTIDEFLADEEVTNNHLRDLCLKMEHPGLQELRDACADLGREDSDDQHGEEPTEFISANRTRMFPRRMFPQKSFQTSREKILRSTREKTMPDGLNDLSTSFVDFGHVDDEGQYRIKHVRVKVCGRWIYNYPSDKAMTRGGWLQFSIIAKDSSLFDAMALCRNWDEFWELNVLAFYNYFPATNWWVWTADIVKSQLLQLGLIPYLTMPAAKQMTASQEVGSRRFGKQRTAIETRNFICAYMKRNDPVSRRLIQYLAMQTSHVVMMVRDVKTGKYIVEPPDDQLWLVRKEGGFGGRTGGDWVTVKSVDPDFFEEIDRFREFSFGFKEVFDIIVWDRKAGRTLFNLYNTVLDALAKAHRFQGGLDFYRPAEHILRSITRDPETQRCRDLKPSEVGKLQTVWDSFDNPEATFYYTQTGPDASKPSSKGIPREWLFDEADRLEAEVLFPEDNFLVNSDDTDPDTVTMLEPQRRQVHAFENGGLDMERFVFDLNSDEELSDLEEEHHDDCDCDEDDGWTSSLDEDDDDNDDTESMRGSSLASSRPNERDIMMSVKDDYDIFIDRERARVFKDCWHRAGLEPGAQQRYIESTDLLTVYGKWFKIPEDSDKLRPTVKAISRMIEDLKLYKKLGQDAKKAHKRITEDLTRASDLIHIFFTDTDVFLASEAGKQFANSLLLKQPERAKQFPDVRSPHSNTNRPKGHWKEWDTVQDLHKKRNKTQEVYWTDCFPPQFKSITRPTIAHLYKEGVICPRYDDSAPGYAVCLTEPERKGKPDLYFDWRESIPCMQVPPEMVRPDTLPHIVDTARAFATKNPNARFSVLRLWSAPHFWPLMLAHCNREGTSFIDDLGRCWEWKFVPKDMPFTECSIQNIAQQRITPYKQFFGDKVVVKKDQFLVMGVDEVDCRNLSIACVWAITTRPWRLEVDAWKSWFNVDFGFLNGLDAQWWI